MELSGELIKGFVDATNDAEAQSKASETSNNVYATVKTVGDTVYVQIDGSQVLTPVVIASDVRVGDRVLLMISDHKATIISNTTSPPSGRTATELEEEVNQSLQDERKAREDAIAELAKQLADSSTGLYQTTVEQSDGSYIYYLHDRPTLAKSALVIKLTAGGIGISQDGGSTFPYGFNFVTGDAIAETIYAGASWIEQLFATEITATNLHITGNSTFGGTLGTGVVTTDSLSSETQKAIISTDTLYYLATAEDSGVTVSSSGWTTTAQSVNSSKKYLWTFHRYTYADGSSSTSEPVITGVYGDTGTDAILLYIGSSNGTVFKNDSISTVLTVTVYSGSDRITDMEALKALFGGTAALHWSFQRLEDTTVYDIDPGDSRIGNEGFTFTLTADDVDAKATFFCELTI